MFCSADERLRLWILPVSTQNHLKVLVWRRLRSHGIAEDSCLPGRVEKWRRVPSIDTRVVRSATSASGIVKSMHLVKPCHSTSPAKITKIPDVSSLQSIV